MIDSVVAHQPAPVTSVSLLDVDPRDACGLSSGSFDCLCVQHFPVPRSISSSRRASATFSYRAFRLWSHRRIRPPSSMQSSCLDVRVCDLLCLHGLPCKALSLGGCCWRVVHLLLTFCATCSELVSFIMGPLSGCPNRHMPKSTTCTLFMCTNIDSKKKRGC